MPSSQTDRINGLGGNLAIKAPVIAVATEAITLSGVQTVNGVALAVGDRVLVTAQTNAVDNGIYNVRSDTWVRAADMDGARDVVGGTLIVGPHDGGTGNWLDDATAETVGEALYPATDSEIAAGVDGDITAFQWPPGDIRRYGALDAAADNSDAFNSAYLQAAETAGADVYIPPGTWTLTTSPAAINTENNIRIYGDGYNKSAIVIGGNSVTAISFTGVCARCSVRGVWIGSFVARTGTIGISIVGTSNALPCAEFTAEDVKIQNINSPMILSDVHQSYFDRIRIVNSVASGVTGVCINATAMVSVRFRDVQCISTSGLFGSDCIRMNDDCDTLILDTVEVAEATGIGIRLRNPAGATGPRLVRLLNCYVESCTSAGFAVEDDCRDVRFQGCHAAVNDGNGFSVTAGESIQYTDCFSLHNDLHGFYAGGGAGIKFLGCEASNNSQAADNTYDGIYVDTDYVRIVGCKSGDYVYSLANDQRYGLTIASGTDYIFEGDNDLTGNETGEINYASTEANNQITHIFKGSKTFDWGSLADGAGESTTVTVLGADLGDFAEASHSVSLAGCILSAYVTAADTVTVRLQNETGAGPVDIASGTLRARVRKA